jgi:hypothetical protein
MESHSSNFKDSFLGLKETCIEQVKTFRTQRKAFLDPAVNDGASRYRELS